MALIVTPYQVDPEGTVFRTYDDEIGFPRDHYQPVDAPDFDEDDWAQHARPMIQVIEDHYDVSCSICRNTKRKGGVIL